MLMVSENFRSYLNKMENTNIKITVNAEWQKAIHELLDVALKSGGIQAFNGVAHILQAMTLEQENSEEKPKK